MRVTSALPPTPPLKVKDDRLSGDLLVKQRDQNVSVSATGDYKDRVSMSANFSLLLSSAKLSDQRTFTCMQADGYDIKEFTINVVVYSE